MKIEIMYILLFLNNIIITTPTFSMAVILPFIDQLSALGKTLSYPQLTQINLDGLTLDFGTKMVRLVVKFVYRRMGNITLSPRPTDSV